MTNPLPNNWRESTGPAMPIYTPPMVICAGCAAELLTIGATGRWAVTGVGPLRVCGYHVDWALQKLGYPAAPPSPEGPEGA